MKAIVLDAFGGVDNLHETDWPKPEPQEGEVRIRVHATAFNPVDCKLRLGRFDATPPMVLGSDASGTIDRIAHGSTDLAVGDEVYAYLGGPKSNGSYAQYVCVPAAFVARKPSNLSFCQASAVPLVGLTAYQALVQKARVGPGQAIFIAGGSGGVGSMAILLARHLGADPIFTTAGSERSFNHLTQELGVPSEHILRYRGLSPAQLKDRALQMSGGRFVSAAFDFWGGDMKLLCCDLIGFDGHVVSIVEEPAGYRLNVWNARRSPMFARCASLHFEFLGARAMFGGSETWHVYREQLETLTKLIEGGHIKLPEPIDVGAFSGDAVREAHTLLEQGHVRGKLVMSID